MSRANLLRARLHFALIGPLALGCTQLARGFPDATTDASVDARTDAADAPATDVADALSMDVVDAATIDAPDVASMDRPDVVDAGSRVDRPDVVDAPSLDRPDVVASDIVDVPTVDRPDVVAPDIVDVPTVDRPDVVAPDIVDVPTVDRPDVVDIGVCQPGVAAQLLRPPSGARITGSANIQFRWTLPPGADAVRLDFCANRSCTNIQRSETVAGTSLRTGLSGRRWWRVQPLQGGLPCGEVSPTWWVVPDMRGVDGTPYRVMPDVNGDGVTDAFISGLNANNGEGRAYVYLGNNMMGLPPTPHQRLSPPQPGAQYGIPVSGDFNGDGYADVAVAQSNPTGYVGRVWAYLSDRAQIDAGRAPTELRQPGTAYNHFGLWMFSGDFNGDGFADLAVTAGSVARGGVSTDTDDPQGGRFYVYNGGLTGLSATESEIEVSPGGADSEFGNSGMVVDLDNDGFDDLLVNMRSGSNREWVHYRGSSTGLQRQAVNVRTIAGTALHTSSPSNLGDVTGDGRVDIGTIARTGGPGVILVASGAAATLGSEGFSVSLADAPTSADRLLGADISGDGLSDLVLTQVVGGESRIYVYRSEMSSARYLTQVAPLAMQPGFDGPIVIGDYNGDGFYDVLAGHPSFMIMGDVSGRPSGGFSVVIGTSGGFVNDPRGRGVLGPDPGAAAGFRLANLSWPRRARGI